LYPHQLSGGMSQRVGIAMAMMPRPQVLVVDEPTSALDAQLRSEVLRVIRTLSRDFGTAVLLISHDLGLVGEFCDRVVVMYAGRAIEVGGADDVLRHPSHPYSVALRDVSPNLDAEPRERLRTIPGAPPQAGQWPSGCVFEPRCPRRRDVCRAERPALEPREGRPVACFFPGEQDPEATS
ncbi:MAG TPA: oligopeptide/dipeptide ABC transporter ATP-binding protein, partial [Conexibacter sp.]|nr:oligopeptide/dipeptide ABC transporter ATP-binding protein [Conexibacter sp.]